jgi:hypothetical protein
MWPGMFQAVAMVGKIVKSPANEVQSLSCNCRFTSPTLPRISAGKMKDFGDAKQASNGGNLYAGNF